MKDITFITGNQNKADYLAKYLGVPIKHQKVELDELQSLELSVIVEHKVRRAYEQLKSPVLVEDVSLEFTALGRLPGPFIKWFVDELDFQTICSMLGDKDRTAVARCMFGYYDGNEVRLFEGSLKGKITETPRGSNGYGWDQIFIPEGYDITRAEMNEADDEKTYTQIKPFAQLKKFITEL